jgi:hypothetical protein
MARDFAFRAFVPLREFVIQTARTISISRWSAGRDGLAPGSTGYGSRNT